MGMTDGVLPVLDCGPHGYGRTAGRHPDGRDAGPAGRVAPGRSGRSDPASPTMPTDTVSRHGPAGGGPGSGITMQPVDRAAKAMNRRGRATRGAAPRRTDDEAMAGMIPGGRRRWSPAR